MKCNIRNDIKTGDTPIQIDNQILVNNVRRYSAFNYLSAYKKHSNTRYAYCCCMCTKRQIKTLCQKAYSRYSQTTIIQISDNEKKIHEKFQHQKEEIKLEPEEWRYVLRYSYRFNELRIIVLRSQFQAFP